MKKKIQMFTTDTRGFIMNRFWDFSWKIQSFWSTFVNYMKLYFLDIEHGSKLAFYGAATFKRAPLSKIKIGNNCTFRSKPNSNLIGINRPCMISTLKKQAIIEIGNNCGFSGTVIGAFTEIRLGNNIKCGANTLITDSDWHTEDPRSGEPKPVIIGDNVWLGVNVTVLKGVTIGENSLIGAGSVVIKDIPSNVIAVGNPCKVVKEMN